MAFRQKEFRPAGFYGKNIPGYLLACKGIKISKLIVKVARKLGASIPIRIEVAS
jgi:hypothetical protein